MASETNLAPTCHIVQVVRTPEGKLSASSSSVPEPALQTLTRAGGIEPRRRNRRRNEPPLQHLFGWLKEYQLSRVVIVWNVPALEQSNPVSQPIDLPSPLLTPGEPVPLDNWEAWTLRSAGLLSKRKPRATDKTPWWQLCFGYVLGPPLLLFVVLPILVLASCAAWLSRLVLRTDWLVVPGAAIRRRVLMWQAAPRVEVFTPADILLLLTTQTSIAWEAQFCRERQSGLTTRRERRNPYHSCKCRLGDDAVQLLLAAWQSPLPPPKAEDLVDLR